MLYREKLVSNSNTSHTPKDFNREEGEMWGVEDQPPINREMWGGRKFCWRKDIKSND